MTWLSPAFSASCEGLRFAVQYNPLFAALTAALAAALMGFPRAKRDRREWAAIVLTTGWLVGDGLRILARGRDYYDGAAGAASWPGWTMLAVWTLGSFVLGYAVPALVGASVGRRVTHGTGWLAAAAIASALTLAVSAGVGALG